MANVIAQIEKPTLIISPNKTLAARLCQEFRTFFPDSAVEYFVSYYDYYQPEAYIPQTDTYIEKDSSINDEIDRLRHSATMALLTRKDVIVVASVSCIYSLGTPQNYLKGSVQIKKGQKINQDDLLLGFVKVKYERNDVALARGKFRVKGDTVEIGPAYEQNSVRFEFLGDQIERIVEIEGVTGRKLRELDQIYIFPATHYVTLAEELDLALASIERELQERIKEFKSQGKELEAKRIESRTHYDMEMIRETGYCHGVENYSRHFDGRSAGDPPGTLLDYFPEDYLLIIDESHVAIPQIGGMQAGDFARKKVLVEHGFRLPSAIDNRPLNFKEFEQRVNQVVYASATPGDYEIKRSKQVVEQIIRPTGLIDPEVIVKKSEGQIKDLIQRIDTRIKAKERVLVTTLTKRMAEDLSEYLNERNYRVRYLHSDIDTLGRIDILRGLRTGEFDVLVGINLLREGLDLPEVSLVAILDADKEGFLRAERSLIQTIGRAARNVNGQVVLYADNMTGSMQRALKETNRRRKIQIEYNQKHNITPETIVKEIRDIREGMRKAAKEEISQLRKFVPKHEVPLLITSLEEQMRVAATELEFEKAAGLRDKITEVKRLFGFV
jgi:excinuclease ABC subunit B